MFFLRRTAMRLATRLKTTTKIIFTLLICTNFIAYSIDEIPTIPPELLHNASAYLTEGIHNGLKNAFVEGMKEGIPPLIDHTSQTLQNGIAEGLRQGIPAVINDSALAFRNQFEDTGDAHHAVGNMFKTVGTQFEGKGEGKAALQKVLKSVGDEFADTGEGRIAALNTAKTTSAYIENVGTTAGSVITKIFIKNSVISVLSALGIATAWYGSKLLWHYIEKQLKKPKIIIASSRKGVSQRIKRLFKQKKQHSLKDTMVFAPELQKRLDSIILTTKNINQKIKSGAKNVKFRNIALYGPPGTGKTLFAQELAKQSGMEYAIVSGSSFAKKGALEAMDELFAWAYKSKGLILIIDEAECLMPNRANLDPDSDSYRVMTNFLNYTGTRSSKYMIVMATNRLEIIDDAMHRRIDDLIEMPLPAYTQRLGVLQLHSTKILFDTHYNSEHFVSTAKNILCDAALQEIALKTEGFSNGDLQGLINMIKTDADVTQDGVITQEVLDTAVQRMVQKHKTLKGVAIDDQVITVPHMPDPLESTSIMAQIKNRFWELIDWLQKAIGYAPDRTQIVCHA